MRRIHQDHLRDRAAEMRQRIHSDPLISSTTRHTPAVPFFAACTRLRRLHSNPLLSSIRGKDTSFVTMPMLPLSLTSMLVPYVDAMDMLLLIPSSRPLSLQLSLLSNPIHLHTTALLFHIDIYPPTTTIVPIPSSPLSYK
jgi:hypothetical protein